MPSSLKYLFWPILVGILAGLLILEKIKPDTPQIMQGFSAAVRVASPAVVNIFTQKKVNQRQRHKLLDDPFFGRFRRNNPQQVKNSLGSGVVMRSDGYIVTNNHVINGATQIEVLFSDGRRTLAEVVGTDPDSDLAVLKVPLNALPTMAAGNVMESEVGDIVLAIGNPYGFGQSVTQGIISAKGRYGIDLSKFEDFIQTDASINPGNSGGALIDTQGKLLGINSMIFSSSKGSQGIGLAIPTDAVVMVVEDLIKYGHVMRGWLGIEVEETSDGVFVSATNTGGPAAIAGLQPGDRLVGIDQHEIVSGLQARDLIAKYAPGSSVTLAVQRGGLRKLLTASVGLRSSGQSR